MARLEGKVALVTGGASGIGKSCAVALAAEGAAVMITDIDEEGGNAAASEIQAKGGRAQFHHQDVTDEARWTEIIGLVKTQLGPLSITVNNAGIGIGGLIWEFSLEDWRKQTAINLDGVFLGTRASIWSMSETSGGSITNISSVAGLRGAPGLSGYCATKGGVRLFSKAVALECAHAGLKIRVNSVHPGIIDTPIWTKTIVGAAPVNPATGDAADAANAIDPVALAAQAVPGGVVGKPENIADTVVFLASDEAAYVNGTEIVVDGGFSA